MEVILQHPYRRYDNSYRWIMKVLIFILQLIYYVCRIFKRGKKIVMLSRQADSVPLDMKLLRVKLNELYPDYKVVVLAKRIGEGALQKILYCFHVIRQIFHIATADAAILDSYCIPISILKHNGLLVIQMWHSVGTMKKFGLSILDQAEGSSQGMAKALHMHEGYDYVLCASPEYREHLMDGFNVDSDKIAILPLPRVELLQDKDYVSATSKKIKGRYPTMKDRINIVYLPTFRKNDSTIIKAVKALADNIDYDKYNLIVKLHPLDLARLNDDRVITADEFSSFEVITAADVVISDYSCIVYEAGIAKKPVYFYAYDYEEYSLKRDMYIDYIHEMPSDICYTAKEVMQKITQDEYDFDRLAKFVDKYVKATGTETADIAKFIVDKITYVEMKFC